MKTPWHERMEVARFGLWAPDQPLNYCVPELYRNFVAYMYVNCSDNTEGEYEKRMNHFKKLKKQNKTKQKKRNNQDIGTQR